MVEWHERKRGSRAIIVDQLSTTWRGQGGKGIVAHYIWINDILLCMERERERRAGRLKGGTRGRPRLESSRYSNSRWTFPKVTSADAKGDKLRVEGQWWNDLEFAGGVKVSRDYLLASQPRTPVIPRGTELPGMAMHDVHRKRQGIQPTT